MPLTKEQFEKARSAGFSFEQIVEFEKRREPSSTFKGGETRGSGGGGSFEDLPTNPLTGGIGFTAAKDPALALEALNREVGTPIRSGASTAAFNIPRVLARMAGKEEDLFPEPQTAGGKALNIGADIAGLFGGGAASLAKKAQGQVATRLATRKGGKLAGDVVGGAVFGGSQLDLAGTGPTLEGQFQQALTGGIAGGLVNLVTRPLVAGGGKAVRAFRKWRQKTKTPPVENLKSTVTEEGRVLLENVGMKKKESLEKVNKQIKDAKQSATEQKDIIKKANEQNIQEAKATLKENIKVMEDEFQSAAETGSQKYRERLPEFFKENSRAYGETLDDISSNLAAKGDDITFGEADDIFSKTISDLDESLITEGKPRAVIEQLRKKYTPRVIEGTNKFNIDDTVPFKELVEDIKKVKKALSASAKSGASRFSQEDVAVSILNKNMGEFVGIRVPEFGKLQNDYKSVIDVMKSANKEFKPLKGKFENKAGTNFLKKFGLGNTTSDEEALIKTLEEGTDVAGRRVPGVGNISGSIKSAGQELQAAKERVGPIIQQVKNEGFLAKEGVDKALAKRVEQLTKRKEFINSSYIDKERMLNEELRRRLIRLTGKEKEINNLMADKQKVQRLWKILGWSIGGPAIGVIVGRALSRGGRE